MKRPGFEQVYMTVAHLMATRSTCPRARTGAVICTPDWQVLTTGYNGAPQGQPHCVDAGCYLVDGHCLRTVHAEMNAILQAARLGIPLNGSTLLATHRPCVRCAPAILRAGIDVVLYAGAYDTDESYEEVLQLFSRAGKMFALHPYSPVSPVRVAGV